MGCMVHQHCTLHILSYTPCNTYAAAHTVAVAAHVAMAPKAEEKKPPVEKKAAAKRKAFILSLFDTATHEQVYTAAKAAGLHPSHAIKRVRQQFEANGVVPDPSHQLPARVYTAELLEQALDKLIHAGQPLTAAELLNLLRSEGLLTGTHKVQCFTQALRNHAEDKGWHVCTDYRKVESYLAPNDPAARVSWCIAVLKELDSGALTIPMMVFEDETSIQETVHPKGVYCTCKCKAYATGQMLKPDALDARAAFRSKHKPGALHVREVMKTPQGPPHANAAGVDGSVRGYKAAVFLQLGKPNYVHTVSSTQVPGLSVKKYNTAEGGKYKSLSGKELCSVVDKYAQARESNPGEKWVLVMDGDRTHTSKVFAEHCKAKGYKVLILPPRSHDLSPPDSHFFAQVKNEHARVLSKDPPKSWEQKAKLLQRLLQETNADAHLKAYEQKLRACLLAEGQRFERELAGMRAAVAAAEREGIAAAAVRGGKRQKK